MASAAFDAPLPTCTTTRPHVDHRRVHRPADCYPAARVQPRGRHPARHHVSRRTTATSHSECGSRGPIATRRVNLRSARDDHDSSARWPRRMSRRDRGRAEVVRAHTDPTASPRPLRNRTGTPVRAERSAAPGPDLPMVDPHGGGGTARIGAGDRCAVAEGQGTCGAWTYRGGGGRIARRRGISTDCDSTAGSGGGDGSGHRYGPRRGSRAEARRAGAGDRLLGPVRGRARSRFPTSRA